MPKGTDSRTGGAIGAALATRERNEGVAALASLMVDVLGTDMLRGRLGRERALQLLKLAGRDTGRIEQSWAAAEPVRRQVSESRPSQGYGRDPRHDPQVVQAILANAPHAEVNALIKQAQERLAASPPPTIGPPGTYKDAPDTGQEMGVSYETVQGPDGPMRRPVQRSIDYASWEELHAPIPAAAPVPVSAVSAALSAPAPPPQYGGQQVPQFQRARHGPPPQPSATYWQPGPVDSGSVTECDHEGSPAGSRFCMACGAPRAITQAGPAAGEETAP
jgi:hypothetical protein